MKIFQHISFLFLLALTSFFISCKFSPWPLSEHLDDGLMMRLAAPQKNSASVYEVQLRLMDMVHIQPAVVSTWATSTMTRRVCRAQNFGSPPPC